MFVVINNHKYRVSSFEQLSRKFDELGRDTILDLTLSDNQLASLPVNIFTSLGSLKTLNLSGNHLSSLPPKVFESLCSLETLWLGCNRLASLPENVFTSLRSLQKLLLSGNRLSSLSENIFSSLTSLRILTLNANQFTSLPENVFTPLVSLQELNFDIDHLASPLPKINPNVKLNHSSCSREIDIVERRKRALEEKLQTCIDTYKNEIENIAEQYASGTQGAFTNLPTEHVENIVFNHIKIPRSHCTITKFDVMLDINGKTCTCFLTFQSP
jgi:Leucine-rich repeat (LRR) protein